MDPSRDGGLPNAERFGRLSLFRTPANRIDGRLNIILMHKSHGKFSGDRYRIDGVVVVGNGGGVDVGCREIVIGRGSIGCGVNPSRTQKLDQKRSINKNLCYTCISDRFEPLRCRSSLACYSPLQHLLAMYVTNCRQAKKITEVTVY